MKRLACGLTLVTGLFAFQRPFHQFPGTEYFEFETPPDWQEQAEWTFARMMFPSGWNDGYRPRFQGDWRKGLDSSRGVGAETGKFADSGYRQATDFG